jgi:thymidine kinase
MAAAGRIELVFGPMFSGKTGEAMRRLERMRIAGKRCLAISYARDERYGSSDALRTHNGHVCEARPALMLLPMLPEMIVDGVPIVDVVAIDEGQFFADLVPFCDTLADVITHLTAVCTIHASDGPFSRRITADNSTIHIGGTESYVAACRTCMADEPAPASA